MQIANKIAVRSGDLGEFLEYVKQRGLQAKVENSSAGYLQQVEDGDLKYGHGSIGVGDKIFFISVPSEIGSIPDFYLLTIE